MFWERKSAQEAQRLFNPSTSTQRAVQNIPIWASEFKVQTFSETETFWAYVDAQARNQENAKSVREAMNEAKDLRLKAQFKRVEDQFAKANKDLQGETQKAEKTVAQVTSVWIYRTSYIQISENIHQKPLSGKTIQEVKELKMLLAGLEIRAKAVEEKVVKSRRAIVVERAQIAKLEVELAERQEDERRHALLQLVTKYRAKVSLSSADPEKEVAQKLLLNDVRSLLFHRTELDHPDP